jgi:hypothetical protein
VATFEKGQWARNVESDIDKGIVVDRRVAERLSLAEILERYRYEVTPTKRGAADEDLRSTRTIIPPHVHVIGPASDARIALGGKGERPWLMTHEGLSRRQVAAALVEISRNRELLMQRWREIHGDA